MSGTTVKPNTKCKNVNFLMKYFVVDNKLFDDKQYSYGEKYGNNSGEAVRCKCCNNFLTLLKWLPPYEIKLSKRNIGDFIFGSIDNFIVSDNFKEIYEKGSFSGIQKFNPVILRYKSKTIDAKYYFPDIILSDAKVDLEKSKAIFGEGQECSFCQKGNRLLRGINGLYLLNPENIKEDVFNPMLFPGRVILSEKIVEAISHLTNLKIIQCSNYHPRWLK